MNIAQYDSNERDRLGEHSIVPLSNGSSRPFAYNDRFPHGAPAHDAHNESGHLLRYLRVIWGWKWLIALAVIAAAAAGFASGRLMTPIYRSHALLEVRSVNVDYLNRGSIDPTAAKDGFVEDSFIQTQKRLLRSEALLSRVLALHASRPDLERGLPWSKTEMLSDDEKLARLSEKIDIQSTGFTKLVEVAFESPDPKYAADFVNTLSEQFIVMNIEGQREAIERTGLELSLQLGALRDRLLQAEQELSTYAKSRNLFITEGNENIDELRLKQLQAELSTAQATRTEKQSQFEQVSAADPESLPRVLDDPSLKDTSAKITELKQRVAELSITLTPAHHKTRALQAQLSELEASYGRQRENILRRLRNEYESAKRREDLLSQSFSAQSHTVSDKSAKALRFASLRREVDLNGNLYESMLQKAKEAQVVSAMQSSNIRIVDPARVPSRHIKPNPAQNAVLAGFAGLMLSTMVVLMYSSTKTRLKEPGEAGALLGVPELGAIPTNIPSLKPAAAESGKSTALSLNRPLKPLISTTLNREASLHAESFRSVVTAILAQQVGSKPFSLVVTSPSVGDGKTSTVANLGIVLAGTGRKTLLIDGDLRKPALHSVLRAQNESGLSQALEIGQDSLSQFIQTTDIPNLYLMASGGPHKDVGARLLKPTVGAMLKYLRHHYEVILIDTPPVLHIADARAFARHTDGVVLIVRSSKTKRDIAIDALQLLESDASKFFGVILNDWNPRTSSKADTYYEYHNSYFSDESK